MRVLICQICHLRDDLPQFLAEKGLNVSAEVGFAQLFAFLLSIYFGVGCYQSVRCTILEHAQSKGHFSNFESAFENAKILHYIAISFVYNIVYII